MIESCENIVFNCEVIQAKVYFKQQKLIKPLELSKGTISEMTEAVAEVEVKTGKGNFKGYGSIYLSDIWAWPHDDLSHEYRDNEMRQFTLNVSAKLPGITGHALHPLELGLRLHQYIQSCDWSCDMPLLAKLVCSSPFDAAIHDAVGKASQLSAMDMYRCNPFASSMDNWFDAEFGAFQAIQKMLLNEVNSGLDAWVVVGQQDDLNARIKPWFTERNYRCFKLKIHGQDADQDYDLTTSVYETVKSWGCEPRLSVDANESTQSIDTVTKYLSKLKSEHPAAYKAVEYMEQPTTRDIVNCKYDWHEVSKYKSVFLDEGCVSMETLELAIAQGWSGLALKTCKGHSFMLISAAYAHMHGMKLAMQDLTNPGLSAIHSAIIAATTPVINGIEMNSPQFTPDANKPYLGEWSGLFDSRNGQHCLPKQLPFGLGAAPDLSGFEQGNGL